MKISKLLFLFFLSACATVPDTQQSRSLEYNKILEFKIGTSAESDVVKVLGAPASRIEKNGYYTLNYVDPKLGNQRLSINFSKANQKLSGFLWIPQEDEKEFFLEQAKASFKNSNFKEVQDIDSNPHAVSKVISFIDEKSGVTIRYDRSRSAVEAIAVYDMTNRVPAATEKIRDTPYTFGDESVTSK